MSCEMCGKAVLVLEGKVFTDGVLQNAA